jgi:hypothetical protein
MVWHSLRETFKRKLLLERYRKQCNGGDVLHACKCNEQRSLLKVNKTVHFLMFLCCWQPFASVQEELGSSRNSSNWQSCAVKSKHLMTSKRAWWVGGHYFIWRRSMDTERTEMIRVMYALFSVRHGRKSRNWQFILGTLSQCVLQFNNVSIKLNFVFTS